MTQREELDLILQLIKKYKLPLSPILEYAVNEKKEEYPEEEKSVAAIPELKDKQPVDSQSIAVDKSAVTKRAGTIELTRELIEAARTHNGDFTAKQLAILGISWPAPHDWIEKKIGTFITLQQFADFNRVDNVDNSSLNTNSSSLLIKGFSTYKDVAMNDRDKERLLAVLKAIEHFKVPATSRDIARAVSRSAWGGSVQEDSVDTILKRLPEVEYVPWGKYILKNKKNTIK